VAAICEPGAVGEEGHVRARAVVHGRVQGVFFRDSTRLRAERHGVSGWVRNRVDGTVEALLEGPRTAVERVLDHLRVGPPDARVERVEVTWEPPHGLRGFEVR
jgi:acylphosphatase